MLLDEIHGEEIMKFIIIGITGASALLLSSTVFAQSVYVKPHVRSDGTYVQGHHRTAPNNSTLDNWSTAPNVNPYTGQQGKRDPYTTPSVPKYKPYSPPQTFKPYTPPKPYAPTKPRKPF